MKMIEWTVRVMAPDELAEETLDRFCDVLDEAGAQELVARALRRVLHGPACRQRTTLRIEVIGTADGGATEIAGALDSVIETWRARR